MQPGEYGYFGKRKIRCVEISPVLANREKKYCGLCCFEGSFVCHFLHCTRSQRPDRRDVIFVYPKTRKK